MYHDAYSSKGARVLKLQDKQLPDPTGPLSFIIKPGACGRRPRAPGFLKSFRPRMLVYVCVCVCVCVSAPEAINNKSRERHA